MGEESVWFIWCCCCCHFKLVMERSIGWQRSICSRWEAVFITLTQTFDWGLCFLAWHLMPEVTVLAHWLPMLTKRKTAGFFGVFCGVCLWFDGCRPTAPGTNAAVNPHHDLHVLSEYLHHSLLWAAFVSLSQHLCQPIRSFWMWWRPPTLGTNASVNPIVIFMCYLNVFTCLSIWAVFLSVSEHLCQPIWSFWMWWRQPTRGTNASVNPIMIFMCYLNIFTGLSIWTSLPAYLISFRCGEDNQLMEQCFCDPHHDLQMLSECLQQSLFWTAFLSLSAHLIFLDAVKT